jgi:hyperosmotically inducible protein
MKKLVLLGVVAAGVACMPLAFGDEGSSDHHFVKDSVITTKVKTKLLAKHMATLDHVKVDTDQGGVVWLSGTVPNRDAKDVAEMIAKDTDGVKAVQDNIEVVPRD